MNTLSSTRLGFEPAPPELLNALRQIKYSGLPVITSCYTSRSGLSWFKRLVNLICWLIGGQPTFVDPWNFHKIEVREPTPKEHAIIDEFLEDWSPTPTCRKCGGKKLCPDPSMYHVDAEDWRGAPLLCLECNK